MAREEKRPIMDLVGGVTVCSHAVQFICTRLWSAQDATLTELLPPLPFHHREKGPRRP